VPLIPTLVSSMAVNVTVETLLRQAASPHQQPTAMSHVWATLRRSVVRVTDLTYMSRMEPLSQPSQQAALPPLALPLQYLRPLVCQPAGCPTDVTEKAPLDVLFRINSQIAKPTLLRFASIPARTSAIRSLVWNMALNASVTTSCTMAPLLLQRLPVTWPAQATQVKRVARGISSTCITPET